MSLLVVQLQALWFTDLADPRDALAVPVEIESTRARQVPGEVREYANGVLRSVTGKARRITWSPKISPIPLALAERLEARAGRPQWVRDPVGGRIVAQFFEPSIALAGKLQLPGGEVDAARISLTLQSLTASEVAAVTA